MCHDQFDFDRWDGTRVREGMTLEVRKEMKTPIEESPKQTDQRGQRAKGAGCSDRRTKAATPLLLSTILPTHPTSCCVVATVCSLYVRLLFASPPSVG